MACYSALTIGDYVPVVTRRDLMAAPSGQKEFGHRI